MSAELSVVIGIGIISGILGYFAFELREHHEKLSWLLFFCSFTFLTILSLTITQIAGTNLAYLSYVRVTLTIMMWINILVSFYIVAGMMWEGGLALWEYSTSKITGRGRDKG